MLDVKSLEEMSKKFMEECENMEKDYEYFLKELEDTNKGIEDTIVRNGYIRFPNDLDIYGYGKDGELNNKYLCYTPNIPKILEKDKDDIAIVSGFGATNTPTVGTLSMMLKLLELQKKTGIYTYCIINDLGSINARNIDVNKVMNLTVRFEEFLLKMGFDTTTGEIRTHNDLDHARTFSLVARGVKLEDFASNGEATDDTYKRLNLKGNDFSVMIDHVYTATDVLLPIFKDHKSGIIIPCGLEEYYHANIGGIALGRLMQDETIRKMLPEDIEVGAIYSKLIKGFYPYFKQSKSIVDSSVNLGNTKEEISNKIMNTDDRDEQVILDMIKLASDFNNDKILDAIIAYTYRNKDKKRWEKVKEDYVEYFTSIKDIWDSCKEPELELKEKIYCKRR